MYYKYFRISIFQSCRSKRLSEKYKARYILILANIKFIYFWIYFFCKWDSHWYLIKIKIGLQKMQLNFVQIYLSFNVNIYIYFSVRWWDQVGRDSRDKTEARIGRENIMGARHGLLERIHQLDDCGVNCPQRNAPASGLIVSRPVYSPPVF